MIFSYFIFYFYIIIFIFLYFTSAVLSELDIIILLKQLLYVNRELISLSLLDWSEVDLVL